MWPVDSVLVFKEAPKALLTAPVSSRRVDILPLSKLENMHTVLQLAKALLHFHLPAVAPPPQVHRLFAHCSYLFEIQSTAAVST